MARITRKQRQRAASEAMAMQREADLARAISGASDTEAAQILQGAGINPTSTTSPVVQRPFTKTLEELVARAISGGTEADVAAAISALTPTVTEELVVGSGESGTGGSGSGAGGAGSGSGTGDDDVPPPGPSSLFDKNAFEIVKGLLRQYNLEGLENIVFKWMNEGIGSEAATAMLREEKEYKERFYGNELRRLAGKNMIDEGTYLTLENDYLEWANYYGITGYFGTDPKQRRSKFATLIGNDINVPEFKERIDTAITRVQRADPSVKNTLRDFYNITDTDLVGYFLNPKENVKVLQEKVTAAEIGGAATAQGLATGRARAEDLARFGIDRETAIVGYRDIAAALPRGRMLGGIYREEGIDYTQQTAEEEEFKQMESARRARRRLAERETATFGGASAIARGSLGSSTAGAI